MEVTLNGFRTSEPASSRREKSRFLRRAAFRYVSPAEICSSYNELLTYVKKSLNI